MSLFRIRMFATFAACSLMMSGWLCMAQDPPAAEQPAAPEATEPEAPADPFAVPETDKPEELLAFIQGLQQFQPKTFEEYQQFRAKAPDAIRAAAQKILTLVPDENADLNKQAKGILLELDAQMIAGMPAEQQAQTLDALLKYWETKTEFNRNDIGLAMAVGRSLEFSGNKELTIKAYNSFAAIFAKNPDLADLVKVLEGAARRADLLGNPMEITGKTVDGQDFDWNAYRGKVVLIDFWATWCGPCRGEHPNIKKNYQGYHEKGFDVVGISLDREEAPLTKYIEEEKVPWTNIYPGQDMATYYGVMGIPTMMLVDKEGKVISLAARGDELTRLLKELLGDPIPAPAEEEKPAETEPEKPAAEKTE